MNENYEVKNMEDNKYLRLARQARTENNSEDAKMYYGKVREEDPENAEAKFFYAYYAMYEGKNGEIPSRFSNICTVLFSSLKMIAQAPVSVEEQLSIILQITTTFVPETWSLNRYMNKKNRETKVGDSYVTVFKPTDISSCSKNGMITIRNLGDEIVKMYPNNHQAGVIASYAWKEYVSLAQKWYAWAPKGEAEVYAEKIKQFVPEYEMPKKAGCISLADSKN